LVHDRTKSLNKHLTEKDKWKTNGQRGRVRGRPMEGVSTEARDALPQARASAESAANEVKRATKVLDTLRARQQQKLKVAAKGVATQAVASMTDADFEAVRALRQLRAPPATVQLVGRCACTLLSVDIPAMRPRLPQLLKWEDAKKILARPDFQMCLKSYDASRLVTSSELCAIVEARAQWSTAMVDSGAADVSDQETPRKIKSLAEAASSLTGTGAGAGGEPGALTMQAALSTSKAAGVLFGWTARILATLDKLRVDLTPSPEEVLAESKAEGEVSTRKEAMEAAQKALEDLEVRAAEEEVTEEMARRAAEEKRKREEAERRRKEEEERKRREEEERRRIAAEAKARREEEERKKREEEEERKREEERRKREVEEKRKREEEERLKREEEERLKREEEERRKREEEERLKVEAEEKAKREAAARLEAVEMQRLQEELKAADDAAARRAERERIRRENFEKYLSSETQRLERELAKVSDVEQQQKQRAEVGSALLEEAERLVLRDAHADALDELMVFVPGVDRQRCKNALEQCDYDVDAAACALLVPD
jgi:hypothetical protein